MNNSESISALKALTSDLVNGTLQQIRSHREEQSPTNKARFIIPEYLLDEALEYVSGAWDLILSDRPKAAVTLSRWVVEASMNLHWVVKGGPDETNERLKALVGEALRNEANLYDGLAQLQPGQADRFLEQARKAREVRTQNLGIEKKLDTLDSRINKENLPTLYPVYRMCCGAAHPALNVWEKFQDDDSKGPGSPISTRTACWMAAQSALHLVLVSYGLTELESGDEESLRIWWTDKVEPLLDFIA